MKTAVTDTSIESYDALKGSRMSGQHAAILAHMQPGRLYSRRLIATLTGLETSAVAGRVNELIAAGQVVVSGTQACPITGRNVEAIRLADKQLELPVH